MKQVQGIWMPDEEMELDSEMTKLPVFFSGAGTYQFRKFATAFPYIHEFKNAIDVGAHVGVWSRVLARCFEHVDAFEPMAKHRECFVKNIPPADLNHVTLHPYAVNARNGTLDFIFDTCATHVVTAAERNNAVEKITVQAVRLDALVLPLPDFIKIDVEGFEFEVITGAENLIRRAKPTIILEQKPNGSAERYNFKQTAASELLQRWGAKLVSEYGGDHILRWKFR